VWEVLTRRPVGPPIRRIGHTAGALDLVRFDEAGRHVVINHGAGTANETFVMHELPSGRVVGSMPRPGSETGTLVVGVHGTRVAWRTEPDNAVLVRDLARRARTDTVRSPLDSNAFLAAWEIVEFSPDGRLLAWHGNERTIVLWDIAGARVVDTLRGIAQGVEGITFSSDGQMVAAAITNALLAWRRGSSAPAFRIARLGVPRSHERTIALSADGALLAYVGQEGAVLVADVTRGETLGAVGAVPLGEVASLAFADGGRRLVIASADGAVTSIDMDPVHWAEQACAIASSDRARARWATGVAGRALATRCQPRRAAPPAVR
jgi:WD40 repeat protein